MGRYLILSFLMLPGFTASIYAADSFVRKSNSSATITASPQGPIKTIVNTAFAFDTQYDPKRKAPVDILLSQRFESTFYSGREGADSTLEVVAWISRKEGFDTKLWTINDNFDVGSRWGDFYRTTKYGCCGSENVHRAYNFRTGKYAFSFTTDPVFVDIPNTYIKRNISYISVMATEDYKYENEFPNGVGELTISAENDSIDRVIIQTNNKELEIMWSPVLSLINTKEPKGVSRLSLWNSSGISKDEAVSGFFVKLSFYEGMDMIIPVNQDKFDIENSVLPEAVSIHRISRK